MNILTIDFETYFDKTYTLKKLNYEEYVRGDKFEAICMAYRLPNGEFGSVWADEIAETLRMIERDHPSVDAVLCHNTQFDGFILTEKYRFRPKYWLDNLAMARLLRGRTKSNSLDSLAESMGLPPKSVPYDVFIGKRADEISPDVKKLLLEGCAHDVWLTYEIYKKLEADFPKEEFDIVHITTEMTTTPTLMGDTELLMRIHRDELARVDDLLHNAGATRNELRSPAKFAAILRSLGIDHIEMKQGAKKLVYPFAKTDDFMKGLLVSGDDNIRLVAEAKIAAGSSLTATRSLRIHDMSTRGPLPTMLNYCGAHTTRWSGGGGVNFQNLPRSGDMRKALMAPDGYMISVVDFSQIEPRLANFVAGQVDVVEAFADKSRDIYVETASEFYKDQVQKSDKKRRHMGKVLEIAPVYGMGANKLRSTCAQGALGGPPIFLSLEESEAAISTFRTKHYLIAKLWRVFEAVFFPLLHSKDPASIDIQLPGVTLCVKGGAVILPNGCPLHYHLRREGREWLMKTYNGETKIYGGKMTENIIQALGRVMLSQAMLRVHEMGYRIPLCTHDEILTLVPEKDAEAHHKRIEEAMCVVPDWLPGFPVAVEGSVSKRYEK